MPEVLTGILRHLLTAGGTFLVTKGYIDTETAIGVTGAIITLIAAGWSIFSARAANVKLEKAIAAPAGKAE